MGNENISDYEQQRLNNIRKNIELLKSLDIQPLSNVLPVQNTKPKPKFKPKLKPTAQPKDLPEPRRSSLRLRGIKADSDVAMKEVQAREEQAEELAQRKKRRLEGRLNLSEIISERTKAIGTTEKDTERFVTLLDSIAKNENDKVKTIAIEENEPPSLEKTMNLRRNKGRSNSDFNKSIPPNFVEEVKNLKIRFTWATVKVVPERIYCVAFHPSADKLLGIAGDTAGNLGFWDISASQLNLNLENDENTNIYTYRPHGRTISHMIFDPSNSNRLFTCSYDESVRCFDLEKAISVDALHFDENDDQYSLSAVEPDFSGNLLYFSTLGGKVGRHDMRTPATQFTSFTLHHNKIRCIHLNPINERLLVTSSNDRTVAIWDTRMMRSPPQKLHEVEHGNAVTSAYWSPDGTKILTTCFDNKIRLMTWDTGILKDDIVIPHNNKTGRWVTMFRATWNNNIYASQIHPSFLIGNMNHPIDIYSGITGTMIGQLHDSEKITAVPCCNAFHPTTKKMMVLSGNSSGRMTCWS